ncbi:MAG TPA: ribosome maturation factor RimM [Bryobacteraceae bacterium]|nr:ribosome maturation factor RimM [Bryobacteraceae bacterium]
MTIARLMRARGTRGEIVADALTAHPNRFTSLGTARLFDAEREQPGPAVQVEDAWQHGERVILKFSGIDTMSDAERLAGMELQVPLAERPAAPEGEFYQTDLVGCAVTGRDGFEIGRVARVESYGGTDLLLVQGEREFLVPFVRSVCVDIDVARRRIVVELPEGLEEL